jgi:GMP synthase (glutamine-hydrolysing) A subunit
VTDKEPPRAPQAAFELGVPVLGICYGMQTMAQQLGGRVVNSNHREFGYAEVTAIASNKLFEGVFDRRDAQGRAVLDVWMSHGDKVDTLPPGFVAVAQSANAPLAAMADESRKFYAVQFHPEVTHTLQGQRLLERFVREICGAASLWSVGNIIEDAIARVRAQVGKGKVLLGLSGGVDSSVVAALLHKAIGDQLGLRVRRSRPAAPQRRRRRHADLRQEPRREGHSRRRGETLPRRAAWRKRPGAQAQDHRRRIHQGLRRRITQARRHRIPGAGHHLPRRHRVGRLQDRQGTCHQVAPQRRWPAAEHAHEAGRASSRVVQG